MSDGNENEPKKIDFSSFLATGFIDKQPERTLVPPGRFATEKSVFTGYIGRKNWCGGADLWHRELPPEKPFRRISCDNEAEGQAALCGKCVDLERENRLELKAERLRVMNTTKDTGFTSLKKK